jgi:hypothetical protein
MAAMARWILPNPLLISGDSSHRLRTVNAYADWGTDLSTKLFGAGRARELQRCRASHRLGAMISIPITDEAYEALKARMPRIEEAPTSRGRSGQLRISLDRKFVDRVLEVRRPGENYSDVILRMAALRVRDHDAPLMPSSGHGYGPHLLQPPRLPQR